MKNRLFLQLFNNKAVDKTSFPVSCGVFVPVGEKNIPQLVLFGSIELTFMRTGLQECTPVSNVLQLTVVLKTKGFNYVLKHKPVNIKYTNIALLMETLKTKGYSASGSIFNSLKLLEFERMPPKKDEVLIDILYCGVCHSDLHQVKNDWGNSLYPCVPGQEIVGRVEETGSGGNQISSGRYSRGRLYD